MDKIISIVIPTKNRHVDLMNLVNSLIDQSLKPNELIVIDQSDTDISKKLVNDKWKQFKNSKLIYVLNSKIKGLVDAKRYGIKFASGDLICFLDDDLILDSRFLEQIASPFRNNLNILGSSGVFTNFPKRSKLYTYMYYLFHKGIFSDPRPFVLKKYEGYDNKLIKTSVLWGGSTIWQSEVFKKAPLDNKNFLFMMEDFDYSAKVRENIGENFFINPNARYIHNHSEVNRPSKTEQEKRKLFEYIVYFKKRDIKIIDNLYLLWLLFGLFLHVLYESMKEKNFLLLLAYFKGISKGINFKNK